jgi:hypothetical protein
VNKGVLDFVFFWEIELLLYGTNLIGVSGLLKNKSATIIRYVVNLLD